MVICFTESRRGSESGWPDFISKWGQLKEINALLDAPSRIKKAALQAKVGKLEAEHVHLKELLRQAKEYIAAL